MIHCLPPITPRRLGRIYQVADRYRYFPSRGTVTYCGEQNSPDEKERKIRKRYPEEFRFILQHWFPGLRHSDYTIHYVVRPFTVEQAKQVFESNPKNLSIEEMFRIAQTYPAGSPEYNKIFMTAVLLNPEHPLPISMQLASCSHREIQKAPHSIWTKPVRLPKRPFCKVSCKC